MRRDMHTINLTFKCLKRSPPMFFKDYFKVFRTIHNTRGIGHNLLFPKVRTEIAKKSFYFNGSKLFNVLLEKISITPPPPPPRMVNGNSLGVWGLKGRNFRGVWGMPTRGIFHRIVKDVIDRTRHTYVDNKNLEIDALSRKT